MEERKELIGYLNNISLFVLGILFLVFPIVALNQTTEYFILPKQATLIGLSLLIILLQSLKTLIGKTVRIRRTPFDLPLIAIAVVFFISSLLAVNRINSLTAFIPFLFAIILYFLVINIAKDKSSLLFIRSSLIGGAVILAILTILSNLKIFVYPFEFAKTQIFSPTGSLLDSALYLFLVFLVALIPALKGLKEKHLRGQVISLTISALIILVGLTITIYQVIVQKTIILPFETAFQTAFAAISQDAGRIFQGFFFGSGFGTFNVDFARFKQPQFNLTPIWTLSFNMSSSFILEILATTGVLGLLSLFYLIYVIIKERAYYVPLILAIIALFILPISFVNQVLFIIILSIFAIEQGLRHLSKFFDIELEVVALKKGLITFETPGEEKKENKAQILAIVVFLIGIVFAGVAGFYSFRYLTADVSFQKSLIAATQNNGTATYQAQVAGLSAFSQNDNYQRSFSQVNLALANNLANAVQKSGKKADTQTTQTIYTLIQQSINSARTATSIAPQTALNWLNLSSIYRNLIGFGQNADQFAILSAQQAILLDPNNPQEYINLGGIYYQLGIWDNAIQQFQIAVNLKQDYANAYYNLGHALEQKGDYKGALSQYQIVKSLVANDKTSLSKINSEIDAIQNKVNGQTGSAAAPTASNENQNLNISTPAAQLPPQNPPLKIPAPKTSITPIPTETVSPTPTQ